MGEMRQDRNKNTNKNGNRNMNRNPNRTPARDPKRTYYEETSDSRRYTNREGDSGRGQTNRNGSNIPPKKKRFSDTIRYGKDFQRKVRRGYVKKKQEEKRQQKRQQIASIIFCSVLLLAVVGVFRLLTVIVNHYIPEQEAASTTEQLPPQELQTVTQDALSVSDSAIAEEPAEETPSVALTVCIDAGHGGEDGGSTSADGNRLEKDDTLNISLKIRDILVSQGVNVIMTRDGDTKIKLSERCQIANDANADLFVSMHRNLGAGEGVEIWVSHLASDLTQVMANNIHDALNAVGVSRDRGVRKGSSTSEEEDYYVTCHTKMPSCIVELGFMTSDTDNQNYDEKIDAYAQAIADAIMKTGEENLSTGTETAADVPTAAPVFATPAASETVVDAKPAESSSTGFALQNEQISLDGLSNELLEWGSGGDTDDKNRPVGATMYQEKYGKYNAYFVFDKSDEKVIYLTSDEGYENGFTPSILDTLKEKNVQITFFCTMDFFKEHADLVQRMIDEGHIIGNHSLTHPETGVCAMPLEEQQKEVMDVHNYVKENFGYDMYLFRYPTGKFSEQSIAYLNNLNYKSVFWSFAYADYNVDAQPDPETALRKCLESLHPGAIYLLHAVSETNAAILGDFIDGARAQGYEFKSLSPDM